MHVNHMRHGVGLSALTYGDPASPLFLAARPHVLTEQVLRGAPDHTTDGRCHSQTLQAARFHPLSRASAAWVAQATYPEQDNPKTAKNRRTAVSEPCVPNWIHVSPFPVKAYPKAPPSSFVNSLTSMTKGQSVKPAVFFLATVHRRGLSRI